MSSRFPCIALAAAALTAAGCGEPSYIYAGYTMYDRFPLDGSERSWTYASLDDEVDWLLFVEKTDSVKRDDWDIVTLEHSEKDMEDNYTVLAQVDWSSDSSDGIFIHAVHVEDGDVTSTFDPPILVAEPRAVTEDAVTTETGGYTFTATFDAIEGCGTLWAPGWKDEDCFVITLVDGDEDPLTNGYIVGTYWLLPSWGAALMELDGYPARWTLADAVWER